MDSRSALRRFGIVLALLATFAAMPASAQVIRTTAAQNDLSCLGQRAGTSLNCTAGEFTVTPAISLPPSSCVAGDTYTIATGTFNLSGSNTDRYDVGFFFGQQGNVPGTTTSGNICSVATVTPLLTPWVESEAVPDNCSDFAGGGNSDLTITNIKVQCLADTNGALSVPFTISYANGKNNNNMCAGPTNVYTTVPSKCQSSVITVADVQVQGYLDITKQTIPDGATDSFAFTSSAGATPLAFTLTDGQTQRVTIPLGSGTTLTVTELAALGWDPTASIVCTNPTGGAAPYVTVDNANRSITAALNNGNYGAKCTITNTHQTRVRTVKALSPTTDSGKFDLSAGGTTVTNQGNGGTTGFVVVTAGAAQTFSETAFTGTNLANYTSTYQCATASGTVVASGSGTSTNFVPPSGVDTTCTFTNSRLPQLTLVKTVTNDNGGTQVATAWTLSASGPSNISGASGSATVTNAPVAPGTYTLSETGPTGYAASTYSCSKNGGGAVSGNSIALAIGDTATCTINNNDQPATLTLVKTVTNDNGGTSVASSWTLTASGPTNISGATGTAPVTNASVNAGTYTLAESGPAGYTASAYTCTNGVTVNASSQITLANGASTTCTINNNDNVTRLTLVKTVTNDNGGTQAATAWTLSASGPTNISGATGSAPVTNAAVNPGTYSLSESGPAGYTASTYSCSINGGAPVSGNSVTLTTGQSGTCTINNNDQPATLTLVKTVTNDNGGTQAGTAWTLSASGPTNISGATGTAPVTNASVNAGTYTLAESGPAGYTASAYTCTNGVTVNGSSQITLANGTSTTCTINNNDQPATLTLVKTVTNDNGGTQVATAWTLSASGSTNISGATGTAPVTNASVSAGTYNLSESGPANYTAGTYSCSINGGAPVSGNSVTLATGQNATCTINNNDSNVADLSIAKTDNVTSVVSGTTTTYTITVSNAGPATAVNAIVTDSPGAGLTNCQVTTQCGVTSGTATCPTAANLTMANLTGGGVAIPSMAAGSSLQFQVTCTVP